MMQELWDTARPLLLLGIGAAGVAVLGALAAAVQSSAWYRRQPWYVRRVIDAALHRAVGGLMPEAEKIKEQHFGKIPHDETMRLERQAVQATLNDIALEHPEVDVIINKPAVAYQIRQAIPAVVEQEKKKRKQNLNQPGGKGRRR
jgi:hypothetical protein